MLFHHMWTSYSILLHISITMLIFKIFYRYSYYLSMENISVIVNNRILLQINTNVSKPNP